MDKRAETRLIRKFIKMFGCDTARISQPSSTMFLIIGHRRNTKDDPGQWYKDDEPIDFDYVAEKIIASGNTIEELVASAMEYKRLLSLSWEDYSAIWRGGGAR